MGLGGLKKGFFESLRLFPLVEIWPKISTDHSQGTFQSLDAAKIVILVEMQLLLHSKGWRFSALADETALVIWGGNKNSSKLYPYLTLMLILFAPRILPTRDAPYFCLWWKASIWV